MAQGQDAVRVESGSESWLTVEPRVPGTATQGAGSVPSASMSTRHTLVLAHPRVLSYQRHQCPGQTCRQTGRSSQPRPGTLCLRKLASLEHVQRARSTGLRTSSCFRRDRIDGAVSVASCASRCAVWCCRRGTQHWQVPARIAPKLCNSMRRPDLLRPRLAMRRRTRQLRLLRPCTVPRLRLRDYLCQGQARSARWHHSWGTEHLVRTCAACAWHRCESVSAREFRRA